MAPPRAIPGPGGWGAIVVTPEHRVTELGGGSPHTTNNKMELSGAIAALQHVAHQPGPVAIYTDSTYVIQGITQWVWGWRKRGWKTAQGGDVLNRDLWEAALGPRRRARPRRGGLALGAGPRRHAGQRARRRDRRVVRAAAGHRPVRRTARRLRAADPPTAGRYGAAEAAGRASSSGRSKAAAYSYLSVVDGVSMRHATWAECEGRVKGRAGARFKKATSAADESAILRSWGIAAGLFE